MALFNEMPYDEKFRGVLWYNEILEGFAPRLVKEELGESKLGELRYIWKETSESIPDDAPDREKYETAYKNFIQNWVSAHDFMRKYQGEAGGTKFMQAAIAGWQQRYSGSALVTKIIGSISRQTAFRMLAKRLAYKLQVFSPFLVSELNGNHMILAVNPCKIPGTSGGNEFCQLACQNIIPVWLARQFNIKMYTDKHGTNCKVTFEPF